MDEIRVRDVLTWDTRIRLAIAGPSGALDRPVSWAVSARTLPPALPKLRGGEVILLPAAVLSEQDVPFPTLVAELARQRVAAVVVDDASACLDDVRDGAPVTVLRLLGSPVSVEAESELNRLLTEHRGEIYRLGTELGRILSNLTATGASLQQILDVTSAEFSLPMFVTDRTGIVLASAGDADTLEHDTVRFDPSSADADLIEHPLRGGGRVWIGPVRAEQRAATRMIADRLASAVESALDGANWFRSRGPERAEMLTNFVLGAARWEPSEARVQAVGLGLDPAAQFRIALSPAASGLHALHRDYAPYGRIHDMSDIAGLRSVLIEVKSGRPGDMESDVRRGSPAAATGEGGHQDGWVAQSGAVAGLSQLTEAARQAAYVAGLVGSGLISRASVRFDRATEMGGYLLLYRHWGSAELTAYADDILGDLAVSDRNGVLRQTLLHFLERGGSRVDAAERAAIHRNTLTYRLRRIAELTRLDPNEPGDRLALHLAILAQALPSPLTIGFRSPVSD